MSLPPLLKRRLVLPLGLAAAAALGLSLAWPWQGLLVNLSMTLIGSILTVGYIDLVLREHEAQQWKDARARIGKRLEHVANVACAQFRIAFGISPSVFRSTVVVFGDPSDRLAELKRIAIDVVRPAASDGIEGLDTKAWHQLVRQLATSCQSIEKLIELFSDHMQPDSLTILLDMHDRMQALSGYHTTFPDVLGVAEADLKPNLNGESSLPLQRDLQGMAVRDVQTILSLCASLYDALDRQNGS